MDRVTELWTGKRALFGPEQHEAGTDGDDTLRIDAMVHVGINISDYWTVEAVAKRDGYDWVGCDGNALPARNGEVGGRWYGLPICLMPTFDVDAVVKKVGEEVPVSCCCVVCCRYCRPCCSYHHHHHHYR